MTLKDCSGYNIQFHQGRPLLIDTLSFEIDRGEAWAGYRQFCEHFLAPLALMCLVDHRLGGLGRSNVDGVPIDLAARLLPWHSTARWGLGIHLHLHSLLQQKHCSQTSAKGSGRMKAPRKLGLVDSLQSTITRLALEALRAGMGSLLRRAFLHAGRVSAEGSSGPELPQTDCRRNSLGPWRQHRILQQPGLRPGPQRGRIRVRSSLCRAELPEAKGKGQTRLLPLVQDLSNPTPPFGWQNDERASIFDRGRPDLVLALALSIISLWRETSRSKTWPPSSNGSHPGS